MTELVPYHKRRFHDYQNDFSILYKRFVCKWIIKDFSKLTPGEKLISPDFRPIPICEWNLTLQKMCRGFSLQLENKSNQTVKVEYVVSLPDLNEKNWFLEKQIEILSMEKTDILDDVSDIIEDLNALNNALKIICDFKILGFVEKESNYIQGNSSQTVYNGFKKLSLDLKNLHMKQKTSITLIADGGQLQAHKWLMCARSPWFEKMLRDQMDEYENITIATGLKLSILEKLVDFLYCGEVELESDIELITSLYSAAEKFEVSDLQQMCADSLMSQLTVHNATSILTLVGKNNNVKKKVQNFIIENFDEITNTDAWNQLVSNATKLACEIVKHYVNYLKWNTCIISDSK